MTYSIVIRTLGNTGGKYLQMLHAIEQQTVKPEEIVVVIPEGYTLDHSLGTERIIHSAKGMVTQRAVGIMEAIGDYLLVLDDDLDFPPDFAEKMHQHLQEKNLDCVLAFPGSIPDNDKSGDITEGGKFPKHKFISWLKRIRGAYTGQVFYSNKRSEYFDVITNTAGHRTYVNCEDNLCQAGCFQCFFIKRDIAKNVNFEEEVWLEQGTITQYAAYDDAVFFYKLFLKGGKIAYTKSTNYIHLDAAAGRPAKDKLTSKKIRLYSIARNRTIFWFRLIWPSRRSWRTLIGGLYALFNYTLYNLLINLSPKNWPAISAMFKGYHDAFQYIKMK